MERRVVTMEVAVREAHLAVGAYSLQLAAEAEAEGLLVAHMEVALEVAQQVGKQVGGLVVKLEAKREWEKQGAEDCSHLRVLVATEVVARQAVGSMEWGEEVMGVTTAAAKVGCKEATGTEAIRVEVGCSQLWAAAARAVVVKETATREADSRGVG